jgi:carboxypeptidase A4
MKFASILPLVLPLASAAVIPRDTQPVSYNGYKVFRIETGDSLASVEEVLAPLALEPWNRDVTRHMDIMLAPDQLDSFTALDLNATVMHEDLGCDIAAEFSTDDTADLATRQTGILPSATWFNNYHSYSEHIQWLRDMQANFPSQSEIITAGASVEGRPLTGIHIWGSGGPGSRPAILWHGTV